MVKTANASPGEPSKPRQTARKYFNRQTRQFKKLGSKQVWKKQKSNVAGLEKPDRTYESPSMFLAGCSFMLLLHGLSNFNVNRFIKKLQIDFPTTFETIHMYRRDAKKTIADLYSIVMNDRTLQKALSRAAKVLHVYDIKEIFASRMTGSLFGMQIQDKENAFYMQLMLNQCYATVDDVIGILGGITCLKEYCKTTALTTFIRNVIQNTFKVFFKDIHGKEEDGIWFAQMLMATIEADHNSNEADFCEVIKLAIEMRLDIHHYGPEYTEDLFSLYRLDVQNVQPFLQVNRKKLEDSFKEFFESPDAMVTMVTTNPKECHGRLLSAFETLYQKMEQPYEREYLVCPALCIVESLQLYTKLLPNLATAYWLTILYCRDAKHSEQNKEYFQKKMFQINMFLQEQHDIEMLQVAMPAVDTDDFSFEGTWKDLVLQDANGDEFDFHFS